MVIISSFLWHKWVPFDVLLYIIYKITHHSSVLMKQRSLFSLLCFNFLFSALAYGFGNTVPWATILYLSLRNIYGYRLQATGVSLCTYFFVVNICVFFVTENVSSRQTFQSAFLGSKFLVASLCPPSSEQQCGFLWCFCVFFPAECSGCNYWWNVRTFLMYWTCCNWWQINCTENICQNRYITLYAVIMLLFLVWKRSAYTCHMKHIKTWVMSQGLERGCFL